MKRKLLSLLVAALLLISGCSKSKKPVASSEVPAAKPTASLPAEYTPTPGQGSTSEQTSSSGRDIKVPVVPEGVDPELWMGDYGTLLVDDSNAGSLYLVDKNKARTTISNKMSSQIGFIFKVSPDRTNCVYVETEGTGKYNVSIYNAKAKKTIKLLSATTSTPQYIHWSPDGKLLLVNDVNYKDDLAATTFNCAIYDASSGAVVEKLPAIDSSWSPDGKKVVFSKVPDKILQNMYESEEALITLSNTMGIYDIDSGSTKYYTIDGSALIYSIPEYSGDGEKIVFISSKQSTAPSSYPANIYSLVNDTIYVYDTKTGTAKKIVDTEFINSNFPEIGYGNVKLYGNLLVYGGIMKDTVKVLSLKDNKSKVYKGLTDPTVQTTEAFSWVGNGNLKILLKGGKSVTVTQDLQEK